MATDVTRDAPTPRQPDPAAGPTVRWDDSKMKTSYANVCNVASTREEIVMLFGVNQAWHASQREIPIQLTDRIILSPFAAKRLSILLGNVLREYESRFGPLPDPRQGA
ncbi:MAG: DUF3467 domain-containing protein [Candidatus Rokubacteria bacterium]|nr:DUF3467 domain-containing protein [Candidatus Rokubacteria bacterium]